MVWNYDFSGEVKGGSTILIGQPTESLILKNFNGTVIEWQKNLNQGDWITLPSTFNTYKEYPESLGIWEYRAMVRGGLNFISPSKSAIVEVIDELNGCCKVTSDKFTIFPNPTEGAIFIQWSLIDKATQYEICDISGSIVQSGNVIQNQIKQFKIDLTMLKGSLYIIKLYGDNIIKFGKVIKK